MANKHLCMSPEKELFLILTRLRLGLFLQDIAHRFNISPSSVSRIFKTYGFPFCINAFVPSQFGPVVNSLMITCLPVLSKSILKPESLLIVLRFFIEMPSSCRSQSITFSSYKNHNTAKGLIGISPNGYPRFVSSLYAGRTSDKKSLMTVGF